MRFVLQTHPKKPTETFAADKRGIPFRPAGRGDSPLFRFPEATVYHFNRKPPAGPSRDGSAPKGLSGGRNRPSGRKSPLRCSPFRACRPDGGKIAAVPNENPSGRAPAGIRQAGSPRFQKESSPAKEKRKAERSAFRKGRGASWEAIRPDPLHYF